jgi:hypothetical protein
MYSNPTSALGISTSHSSTCASTGIVNLTFSFYHQEKQTCRSTKIVPPKRMAPPGKIAYIPTFYRIFFLYIDPLINFSSLYLFFFDHATYISQTIPKSILPPSFYLAHPEITPLENHLITALGSYSIAFLALQISLIHGFKNAPSGLNVKIWKILNGAILLTDLGLLVGGYLSDPAGMVNLAGWGSMEWGNYGALGVIAAIRAAFLLGIGGVGKK